MSDRPDGPTELLTHAPTAAVDLIIWISVHYPLAMADAARNANPVKARTFAQEYLKWVEWTGQGWRNLPSE